MNKRHRWLIGAALGCLGAGATSAQPQTDYARAAEQAHVQQAEFARVAEQVRAQQAEHALLAQRAQAEQADHARELAKARTQVELAARELALLSAERSNFLNAMRGVKRFAGSVMLGINVDPESTELGVRVVGVTPSGPAASAGLAAGDTLVAIDDTDLTGRGPPSPAERLLAQTNNLAAGQTVSVRVLRNGNYRDVQLEPRELSPFSGFRYQGLGPGGPKLTWLAPFRRGPWDDLELVTLTAGLGSYFGVDKGLLVVRAPADSALGFRDGDVILDVGGREPQSPEHALRIFASFEPGETLRVSIMRERKRETLEIEIPTV